MSGVLVWIHGDCLDPQGPAIEAHGRRPSSC